MDFFAQQEQARRSSRWLIVWYLVAAASVVASFCAVAALVRLPAAWVIGVGLVVAAFILGVSALRVWQFREGGPAIAYLLGAQYVDPARSSPAERRLLNVVEEMAIASGVAVPMVYILAREDAINAMAAGYSPSEAVIIVTKGAVQKLSRDELQGVMAHEFSHILNGDMALNLHLAGLMTGLSWLGDRGEEIVYHVAWHNRELPREERGAGVLSALFGGLIAFIGFPGTFAADAIKARISREREFLADAASVQFTRNPDGIAGALDSILALRAWTSILAMHRDEFSHMFFAPSGGRWWGFPTHPPIEERIRRANPRFMRDDYRATRHGIRQEVAVIDGGGNVVKNIRTLDTAAAVAASVGRPAPKHVDFAARLLTRLPQGFAAALRDASDAEAAMFALALELEPEARKAELAELEARRGTAVAARAAELHLVAGSLARNHMLSLADLAVPAIKGQPQRARDRFVDDLAAMVQADRRVPLRQFVLLTLLHQRLREGAGQPVRTLYRRVAELAPDVQIVLSLISAAGREGAQAAFARGEAVLQLGLDGPLAADALGAVRVAQALERLRHLAPFAKPALLKACFETAAADGVFRIAEAELVRMVAATLDCPVPPALAARDPVALAA